MTNSMNAWMKDIGHSASKLVHQMGTTLSLPMLEGMSVEEQRAWFMQKDAYDGNTKLHLIAANPGQEKFIKVAKAAKVDWDVRNVANQTPLAVARKANNQEAINLIESAVSSSPAMKH